MTQHADEKRVRKKLVKMNTSEFNLMEAGADHEGLPSSAYIRKLIEADVKKKNRKIRRK